MLRECQYTRGLLQELLLHLHVKEQLPPRFEVKLFNHLC